MSSTLKSLTIEGIGLRTKDILLLSKVQPSVISGVQVLSALYAQCYIQDTVLYPGYSAVSRVQCYIQGTNIQGTVQYPGYSAVSRVQGTLDI